MHEYLMNIQYTASRIYQLNTSLSDWLRKLSVTPCQHTHQTRLSHVCWQRRASRQDSSTGWWGDRNSPRCAAQPYHPLLLRSQSPQLCLTETNTQQPLDDYSHQDTVPSPDDAPHFMLAERMSRANIRAMNFFGHYITFQSRGIIVKVSMTILNLGGNNE